MISLNKLKSNKYKFFYVQIFVSYVFLKCMSLCNSVSSLCNSVSVLFCYTEGHRGFTEGHREIGALVLFCTFEPSKIM